MTFTYLIWSDIDKNSYLTRKSPQFFDDITQTSEIWGVKRGPSICIFSFNLNSHIPSWNSQEIISTFFSQIALLKNNETKENKNWGSIPLMGMKGGNGFNPLKGVFLSCPNKRSATLYYRITLGWHRSKLWRKKFWSENNETVT